jgi:hypothetical protein
MPNLDLQIAHQVPGRIRLKVASAKGDSELLQQISDVFGVIPGVEQVTVNPVTGSIVLVYDTEQHDEFHGAFQNHYQRAVGDSAASADYAPPATEIDTLAKTIEEEAEFLAQNSASARAVVSFFKDLDRNIKTTSGNNLDLKMLLAGGIIAFTLLEVGAGAATPVWVTLSLFAMNHFVEMHHHPNAPKGSAPPAAGHG